MNVVKCDQSNICYFCVTKYNNSKFEKICLITLNDFCTRRRNDGRHISIHFLSKCFKEEQVNNFLKQTNRKFPEKNKHRTGNVSGQNIPCM